MQWEVGLELGEASVRAATRARGVALGIPSLCAMRGNEVLLTGEEALALEGRAPSGVRFARPIESGRIAEPALVSLWIGRIIEEYIGRLRRRVALVIPPEMPPADRAILRQAVAGADAQCGFIESDLAAAFGARGDLLAPEGVLLIDAGAGSIRASLISYGRVVARRVLPYGMRRIDEDIVAALREGRGFSVGSRTAEELKQQLGSAIPGRSLYIKAAGLNHLTGFPGEIEVEAAIVEGAVRPVAEAVAALTASVIQLAPGDIAADLLDTGILLTGGGARLFGLDRLLAERTGLRVNVPEDPAGCVIRGLHRALVEDTEEAFIKSAEESK